MYPVEAAGGPGGSSICAPCVLASGWNTRVTRIVSVRTGPPWDWNPCLGNHEE